MRAIMSALTLTALAVPAMAERGDSRQQLDTDGDGYVTPEEFSQSELSERVEFSTLDTDNDNLLSRDEVRDHIRERARERRKQRN